METADTEADTKADTEADTKPPDGESPSGALMSA